MPWPANRPRRRAGPSEAAGWRAPGAAIGHGEVLAIAAPVTLSALSTPLADAFGTAFIGNAGDATLLGGVAGGVAVANVVFLSFVFLRTITGGLTAQAVGAGDPDEVEALLVRSAGLALGFGLLVVAASPAIAAIGLRLMALSGVAGENAAGYLALRLYAAPFAFLNFVLLGWHIGRGLPLRALAVQLVLGSTGAGFTALFVLGLGHGARGAGLASLLAEICGAVAGLLLVPGLANVLRGLRRPAPAAFLAGLARGGRANADVFLRSLLVIGLFSAFTALSARFGAATLAGNAVLIGYLFVSAAAIEGFATAAGQLAGRSLGARDRAGVARAARLTLVWALGAGAALSLFWHLAGPGVVTLTVADPAARAAALHALPWLVAAPLLGAFAFQMDGLFLGATWTAELRNMMLLSTAVFGGAVAALTPWLGVDGLWLSLLLFLAVRGASLLACLPGALRRAFETSTDLEPTQRRRA